MDQRWRGRSGGFAVVMLLVLPLVLPSAAQATPPAKPTLSTWGASSAVRAQVIVGTTLYFGGDFTSVISPDGTTSMPRVHLAAIDLTTGDLLPWSPSTNGEVAAMA